MATHLKSVSAQPDPLDDMSLPGWLYHDPEFFAAEQRAFLRAAPQIVCHESEIAEPGDLRIVVRDEVWKQMRLGVSAVMSFDADLRLSRGMAGKGGDIQFANLHSHEPTMIVNNVVALAKTAKVFNVPTILTTVLEDRGGKLIKPLQDVFPEQKPIDRTFINTWEDTRVVDAVKSVVAIENVADAINQIAQTTLRKVVGQHTLDETLSETDRINVSIREILDVQTAEWGVVITLVELKDIQLPDSMKRAMARQAEAEREKRAKIINAEGEALAAAALGEASDTMMAH